MQEDLINQQGLTVQPNMDFHKLALDIHRGTKMVCRDDVNHCYILRDSNGNEIVLENSVYHKLVEYINTGYIKEEY